MSVDVTCFCAYHGRNWLLMESVESFRRLAPGPSAELLILNDCPEQRITCSVPGVRIIQGMRPYATLADKWNAGIAMAGGRWIASWDDDDICLPNRLVQSVVTIKDAPLYWNPWVWSMCHQRERIDQIGRTWISASLFRRDAMLAAGGCDQGDWIDRCIFNKLRSGMVKQGPPEYERIHYIYRWAGEMHDSGHTDDATTRADKFRTGVLNDPRFVAGECAIVPWWAMDYEAAVEDAKQRKVRVSEE